MSNQNPETIVLDFYKSFDSRDIDRAFSYLDENFVAHLAGIPGSLNREGFQKFGIEFYSAFADGQHQFDEIIVTDNKVVTSGTFTAKHLGGFKGLPPTGKQIKISIMHIDRLKNGKIAEHWGQGDAQGLMQQLGIIFLPSPKLIVQSTKNIFTRLF